MKPSNRLFYAAAATVLALGLPLTPASRAGTVADSHDVTTQAIGPDSKASFESGVAAGIAIVGVTVINGEVWIDGEKVPRYAAAFTGRSGKRYRIERDGSAVRVRDQD